jgi:hypothetical protein
VNIWKIQKTQTINGKEMNNPMKHEKWHLIVKGRNTNAQQMLEKYSMSLIIRGLKIKTTKKYCLKSLRMPPIKNLKRKRTSEDVVKGNLNTVLVGVKISTVLMENSMELQKTRMTMENINLICACESKIFEIIFF